MLRVLRDVRKRKRKKKEEKKIEEKWRAWSSILGLAQLVMRQMPSLLVLVQHWFCGRAYRVQNTLIGHSVGQRFGHWRLHSLKANEFSIVILSRCAIMVF